MKTKGQVKLRERKLRDGSKSLYLDIYYKGIRRYEYLHLYLKPEYNPADRVQNQEILRVAEAIRARRLLEVQLQGVGMSMPSERTVRSLLADWLKSRENKSAGTREVWGCWVNRVSEWRGVDFALKDLSREWWQKYEEFVKSRKLAPTTVHHYLTRMRCVLNRAEKDGLLLTNPSKHSRFTTIKRSERVYLTAEELKRLKSVPCPNAEIGRAFLFGCLTGLRYSDIRALRWDDIQGNRIVKRIVKTRQMAYLDINHQAAELLGERRSGHVFDLPEKILGAEKILKRWTESAGLAKHVTFHTSRHTFAVLMLSAGVDIYTLSKLLGHSSVTTTQIYADIVDARKRQAVEMLPEI